ncbi:hypothetical protein GWO13_07270 [Candidatus Bathyarchaeota archaeon]|nr:hypothetical protein [Candidatus Bathyarchaeota archaeon]
MPAVRGIPVHILRQEKSGAFADYLELVGSRAPLSSFFIPNDPYIKEHVYHRPNRSAHYGNDTHYGAKVVIRINHYHQAVLNIPTGDFLPNPKFADLLGAERIFATLPAILSSKYEGALLPLELANGVASLSTYPSAKVLKIFAESKSI